LADADLVVPDEELELADIDVEVPDHDVETLDGEEVVREIDRDERCMARRS
jgi:hypothetical protein